MTDEFNELVDNAVARIPDPFQEKLQEVNIVVADIPTEEQRQKLGLRHCDALFGLYEGVPLTKRNGMVYSKVPDVITIFRHPMIDMYPDREALTRQVYETVWHEVGHFFGFDHRKINSIKQRHR